MKRILQMKEEIPQLQKLNQKSESLPERAANEVASLIAEGKYKPGDKLPSELELAKLLGVSRGTVREAIKILVSRNVLEIHRGNGTFVCENAGLVDDPLGLKYVQDKRQMGLDLLEVRLMIEPQIAAIAAQKATDAEINSMQEICDKIAKKVKAGKNHGDLDIQFHTLLANCTRNSIMPLLIPIITKAIPLFIDLTHRTLSHETLKTHQQIIDAIRSHDSISASKAMAKHIIDNRENMLNLKS
jgi:GntR family transcriptional repressor for pyruvate dehydrogenase complex